MGVRNDGRWYQVSQVVELTEAHSEVSRYWVAALMKAVAGV